MTIPLAPITIDALTTSLLYAGDKGPGHLVSLYRNIEQDASMAHILHPTILVFMVLWSFSVFINNLISSFFFQFPPYIGSRNSFNLKKLKELKAIYLSIV